MKVSEVKNELQRAMIEVMVLRRRIASGETAAGGHEQRIAELHRTIEGLLVRLLKLEHLDSAKFAADRKPAKV